MRALARFLERAHQAAYRRISGSDLSDYGPLPVWIGRITQLAFLVSGITYWVPGVSLRFSAHFDGTELRIAAGIGAFAVLLAWVWAGSILNRVFVTHLCQVVTDWSRRVRSRTRRHG